MEKPADLEEQEHTPTYPQLPVSKVLTSLRTKAKLVINQHREQLYIIVLLLRVGSSVI